MSTLCETIRESLSAEMDGEQAELAPDALIGHLAGCAECRAWQSAIVQINVQQQVTVPDLTPRILSAVAKDRESEIRTQTASRRQVLRVALGISAFVQLALALPSLLTGLGMTQLADAALHTGREAASFDIALAVGFVLAAWRPERARAFVPVAFVLAACLTMTTAFDVASGLTALATEASHVAALAQAALLWALSRETSKNSGSSFRMSAVGTTVPPATPSGPRFQSSRLARNTLTLAGARPEARSVLASAGQRLARATFAPAGALPARHEFAFAGESRSVVRFAQAQLQPLFMRPDEPKLGSSRRARARVAVLGREPKRRAWAALLGREPKRRARARAALLGAAIVALVAIPAMPAQAHAALVRSSPVAGSIVPDAPKEVLLTFSESISPVNDKIRITAPDGTRADNGKPVVDGAILRITMQDGMAKGGTYLVSYRVISADSHPVPGGFTFSVGAPSASPVELPPDEPDTAVRTAIGVAKYIGYAGLLLLAGSVLILALLWPSRLDRAGPRRLMWTGFGLVALGTVAGLYLQAPYTSGSALWSVDGDDISSVLQSQYGTAHLVRLGILGVAMFLVRPVLAGKATAVDRILIGILGLLGALTWPLAGHPAASPVPVVSVIVDALHLAGAAVWLGGLAMLVLFLLRKAEENELAVILPVWSRWATLAVATVLLAGVTSALIEISTLTALVDTTYGRLVLVKAGLVALLLVAAMIARRLTYRDGAQRPGMLRRTIIVELSIAAIVLGVTAALTQTTPGRTAEATAQIAEQQTYSATMTSSIYSLQAEVDPGKRGDNAVHLYAYTLDGKPLPVVEWKATASLPSAGVEPVAFTMLKLTDNHATGVVPLTVPGDWELRFTLRTSDIDQASVSMTVRIK